MSTIAVLIPHFGDTRLLDRCLQSLAAQTRQPDEVMVFNNTGCTITLSTDEWPFLLSIHGSSRNLGFARAVNALAGDSRSDLLFVLNNDATLDRDCLALIEEGCATFADCSSFALPVFDSSDPFRVQSIGLMYTAFGFGNRSSRFMSGAPDLVTDVFCPCGAAAVYRRAAFLRLGGMNSRFFFGGEDMEFGLRLRLAGHNCMLLPRVKVFHDLGATISHAPSLKVRESVKNSLWTLLARHPLRLLLKNLNATARFHVRWWHLLARAGYTKEIALALFSTAIHIPGIVAARFLFWFRYTRHAPFSLLPLYDGPVEVYVPGGHKVIGHFKAGRWL